MKRVLLVNASPVKNGSVSKMVNRYRDTLSKQGKVSVQEIFINDMKIEPCKGCMLCRKGKAGKIEDDTGALLEMLKVSDEVVIGMPVYWANIPGHLKNFFDRSVSSMMDDSDKLPKGLMKGKTAVLLLSLNTSPIPDFFAGESRKARGAIKEIFRYSGIRLRGTAVNKGAKGKKQLEEKTLGKIDSLAGSTR